MISNTYKKVKLMRRNWMYLFFLLPSLLGMLTFYCFPFIISFYYSLINNMAVKGFVGFNNYKETLTNPLFQRAAFNTFLFIIVCVPLGMLLALCLSLSLRKIRRASWLLLFLVLPLIVPSGTMIYFWKTVFDMNGLFNKFLNTWGFPYGNWSQSKWAMGILVIVFLWKNTGYSIVLFWSGLNWIPDEYYEYIKIEGAGSMKTFLYITRIYLRPTTFVVLLMSIVNSFKVFKEVYMLYGNYPNTYIYMLQHYMNNQFMAVNMQKLSSAAYLLFVVLGGLLIVLFRLQNKTAEDIK